MIVLPSPKIQPFVNSLARAIEIQSTHTSKIIDFLIAKTQASILLKKAFKDQEMLVMTRATPTQQCLTNQTKAFSVVKTDQATNS